VGYVPPSSFANVLVGLGQIERAFEWLGRAIDARDPLIMPIKSFPYLDPLRTDPRFTGPASEDAPGVTAGWIGTRSERKEEGVTACQRDP